jgi:hypothetical protein
LREIILKNFGIYKYSKKDFASELKNKKGSNLEINDKLMSSIFRPEVKIKNKFTNKGMTEELRSVVAIFRHGDRTPK